MAETPEKQRENVAREKLKDKGLNKLPSEVQDSLIQRLSEVLKWRADASKVWLAGFRGYDEKSLKQSEEAILNECNGLTKWAETHFPKVFLEQFNQLPDTEKQQFIIRVYNTQNPKAPSSSKEVLSTVQSSIHDRVRKLIKTSDSYNTKANELLKKHFDEFEKLSPLMKIIYNNFKLLLENPIIEQILSEDPNTKSSDLERIERQMQVAKEKANEDRLLRIAKSWGYKQDDVGRFEQQERFISEAFDLFEFLEAREESIKKGSEELLKTYIKDIPEFKEKHPEEYKAFLRKIESLEEEREFADFYKGESFDNKKYQHELESIKKSVEKLVKEKQDEAFRIEVETNVNKYMESFPNGQVLTSEQRQDFKNKLLELEKENILFERKYKIKVFDDSQFGIAASAANLIGWNDSKTKRDALIAKYTSLIAETTKNIRENIKNTQPTALAPEELRNITNTPLADLLKTEWLNGRTDLILMERDAWQLVNPSLIEEDLRLQPLKAKFQRGEILSEKPSLVGVKNKAIKQMEEVHALINLATRFDHVQGLEAFKQLPANKQLEELKAFNQTLADLKHYQDLERYNKRELHRLNNPHLNIPPDQIERPARYNRLTLAEKKEYLQDQMNMIKEKSEKITADLNDFTKKYYKDPYLNRLDQMFGFVEPPPKGLIGQMGDRASELLTQVWYSPRLTSALQTGLMGAVASNYVPILGPFTSLAGGVAGAFLGAVRPELVRPLFGATAGIVAGGAFGGLGGSLIGAVAGGTFVATLDRNPTAKKILTKIGTGVWNFIKYPFKEFGDAYTKYKNAAKGQKWVHGLRMAGIVLGAIIGIAGFVALNVFTAGAPMIGAAVASLGIVGGYALTTACANLGAVAGKGLSAVLAKRQYGFEDPDKYLLNKEVIEKLGPNSEQKLNAIVIGEHFEKRIREMAKVVKTLEARSNDPEHDIEIGKARGYLNKLSNTMDKIKAAGSNWTELKKILDDYTKEEYAIKRQTYLNLSGGLTVANLEPRRAGEPAISPQRSDLETLKREMEDLAKVVAVSNRITEVQRDKELQAIQAAVGEHADRAGRAPANAGPRPETPQATASVNRAERPRHRTRTTLISDISKERIEASSSEKPKPTIAVPPPPQVVNPSPGSSMDTKHKAEDQKNKPINKK